MLLEIVINVYKSDVWRRREVGFEGFGRDGGEEEEVVWEGAVPEGDGIAG